MIDKWFLKDIENILSVNNRLILIDNNNQAAFLIKLIPDSYFIFASNEDVEELKVKYQIEKNHKKDKAIIITGRKKDDLKFIRDYCEIGGCIDLSDINSYICSKLYQNLNINFNLENKRILATAKLSIGKDDKWWHKQAGKLEDLFKLEDELLVFVNDPEKYAKNSEADVLELFYHSLFDLIGQPVISKPPKTLAVEVVNYLFNGLVYNDIGELLLKFYYKWVDSTSYKSSFAKYLENYKVPADVNIWYAHPSHCFEEIDIRCLKNISENIDDRKYINEKLNVLSNRIENINKISFVPSWWSDIVTLFEFDDSNISHLNSFYEVTEYYINSYYYFDTAIRHLFSEFIDQKKLIIPFQSYYENINSALLAKWFQFASEYNESQSGLLETLINDNPPKLAIIVADGLRYEVAKNSVIRLSDKYIIDNKYILADIPSITSNNMSALYLGNGNVLGEANKRESLLKLKTAKNIKFDQLENVNYTTDNDYLILAYKDIDDIAEKLQHRALKFFEDIEVVLAEKIDILLKSGYQKVFITTDHGFVLTGILTEADKIEIKSQGKSIVSERYVATTEKQNFKFDLYEIMRETPDYNYLYFPKTHRPFKTPGPYGYAHGGFTPQEIIIPFICCSYEKDKVDKLKVIISNKDEIKSVVGENFKVIIKGISEKADIFSSQRNVMLLIYESGKIIHQSETFKIDNNTALEKDFTFFNNDIVDLVILDADTKEQIDKTTIRKSKDRDLGGL